MMRELSALGNADADEEMPAAEAAPGRHLAVSYTHLTLPTIRSV